MKKLYRIFLLLSRGKQIAVVVASLHLLTLFILTCHHLITSRLKPPRPMVIKTFAPPAKKAAVAKAAPSQPTKNKPTAAPSQPKKTNPIAAATPKQSKAKAAAPAKKTTISSPAKKAVLKEIAESFDAIANDPPPKETHSPLHIPTKITRENPIAEESESDEDATYGEFLIAFLQSTLDFPEYGEVKMEIEIDSFGKLLHCQILESKSLKNAEFLKKELVQLSYPIPQLSRFETSKKFSITFKNL